MITVSEMFSFICKGNCSDVATSLAMQGCIPNMDIPIYEEFNLHIESGSNAGNIANSVQEYNVLRRLEMQCGAVIASISVEGIQALTLANALLIFTPSCGMTVFLKMLQINIEMINEQMVSVILEAAGMPIPDFLDEAIGLVEEAISVVSHKFIGILQGDLANYGITLYPWDELPDYYNSIKNSGEMNMMYRNRQMNGAATL